MDNLELMKQLPDQCINLIYCDILYNTGKKFKDYDDNLGTPQEAIQWYEPRLIEMKRLLKDTGSIYLQCDYRLVHYLKVKMDEIFGYNNFRNDIVWKRDSVGKGAKKSSNQWSRELDNILLYSKSDKMTFNQQYKTNSELGYTQLKEFRYSDPDGRKFKIVTLGDYSLDSIENMRKQNLIYMTSTGKEYKKYYLDEFKLAVGSLWDDIPNLSHGKNPENIGYDTQKPKKLLERIINASSNNGDLVADFFCGSGTTCVVAKELGRNYLGCDVNSMAIEITKERLYNCNHGDDRV